MLQINSDSSRFQLSPTHPALHIRACLCHGCMTTPERTESRVNSALESGSTTVAFTRDMWTSRASESCVSCTCHLFTPKFMMTRSTLNTRQMAASHIAVNIVTILGEMCHDWEMPGECAKFIVTYNGCNIRAAVRKLPRIRFNWRLMTRDPFRRPFIACARK